MKISTVISEALNIQKTISEQITKDIPMSDKINAVLVAFAKATSSQSVILYATVDEIYLEAMGNFGTDNFRSNIRYNEGPIGICAATKRSQTYQDNNRNCLSIPIIRMYNTIGTIVLQKTTDEEYSEDIVESIETLSISLADFMSGKDFQEYRNQIIKEKGIVVHDSIKGESLNKGYGVGKAVLHNRHREQINIFAENIDMELSRLEEGRRKMSEYLEKKIAQTSNIIGNTSDILEAYLMFAQDKGWYKKISADINKGYTAEAAIEHVYEEMWAKLSQTDDIYIKEKLYDLRDVSDRLRSFVAGDINEALVSDNEDIIIIAQNMGPADLMDYNSEKIRGLVIENGTPTMHVVIVAKALNIPVIAKTHGILREVKSGEIVAINGYTGRFYTNPTDEIIEEYKEKSLGLKNILAELKDLSAKPATTSDNIKINLAMNYGFDLDYNYIAPSNCDGIGLYRTEIMFMSSEKMPDVETQQKQYKKLFDALGNKKIIFRSLDVGSDKLLPYWGEIKEDNPAIGWRSIRITLDRRAILRQQVRAMLRAAADKELNIMFPMISTVQEFLEAKETVMLEYEREKKHNHPTAKKVNVGIMIEVPAVLLQLDELLQEVDFVSIGTNDLYQFIFACDRGNPRLSGRYDVLSAPFLRMMKQIIDRANQYKVYCSVCGEMASNPLEAMVLIGLGYRNLSASGSSYANVKKMIRSMKYEDVADYVKILLKSSKKSLRPQLLSYAYDHSIEID